MPHLLHIESSPRKQRSASIEVARTFISGWQQRHPQASAREQFLRLAIVRLGYDLAVEAFPDAAGLDC